MEGEFVLPMQCFEAIHELAPEHFFEYVTGRKKFCCESIHREWSGDRPPAGTTQ